MAETVMENGVVDDVRAGSSDASVGQCVETAQSLNESQQATEDSAPSQQLRTSTMPTDFEEINLGSSPSLEVSSQRVVDGAVAANCDADSSLASEAFHSVVKESQRITDHSSLGRQEVKLASSSVSRETSSQQGEPGTCSTVNGQWFCYQTVCTRSIDACFDICFSGRQGIDNTFPQN